MTALLLIDLTELALPQPRVSRRAPSAASVRRRKAAKPLSFATSLQRARTADEALALTAQFSPNGADAAALLRKAAIVAPRDSDAVWRDERLARALEAVGDGGADAACDALWALAVLRGDADDAPVDALLADAAAAVARHAPSLGAHRAAEIAWAWRALPLEHPPPESIRAAAASLPFCVHVGCLGGALDLGALRDEVALARDVIRSGSAVASSRQVLESRLTAWQSDAGVPFEYAGKVMAGGALTPHVAAARDRIAASLDRRYDSVLVNYYRDGEVGMRFHSDPGQGEAWGYSTCVASVGGTRLFAFRSAAAVNDASRRCTFAVRDGDVVEMHSDCQAAYQHSVRTEAEAARATERVSLVFKRTVALEAERREVEREDGAEVG